MKCRIQTSCDGESILARMHAVDPVLSAEVVATILEFSNKPAPDGISVIMAEISTGYRLVVTPVGSAEFIDEYFEGKLKESVKRPP